MNRSKGSIALLGAIAAFLISLSPRLLWIGIRPASLEIDLAIYASGGELIAKGVNPYDHSDGTAIRKAIFQQYKQAGLTFPESRERLDYYASTNLPLSLYLYGTIFLINPDLLTFRIIFALADSLVASLAFLIVFQLWNIRSGWVALILGLCVGANPAFYKWGTIYSEDKGIQTLLMFATLLVIPPIKAIGWRRLSAGSLLFGAGVAFKGVGALMAPYFIRSTHRSKGFKGTVVASAVAGALVLATVAPFLTGTGSMSVTRLQGNLGEPGHSSIWVLPFRYAPVLADLKANVVLAIICALTLTYLWFKGRIDDAAFSGSLVFVATVILLTGGSMDRMMLGISLVAATLGINRTSRGVLGALAWATIGSLIFLAPTETLEGAILLLAIPAVIALVISPLPLWLERTEAWKRHISGHQSQDSQQV